MKTILKRILALVLIVTAVSCEDESEKAPLIDKKEKGSLSLSFSGSELKSEIENVAEPKKVIISIKNQNGEYMHNAKCLNLVKLGEGYFTETVELEDGSYTIEDFLVVNANDSVIYLTPKTGSELDYLVSTPLPFEFCVKAKELTETILDVLPAGLAEPSKFGYATFAFNVVNQIIIEADSNKAKDAIIGSFKPDNNFGDLEDIHLYTWTQFGDLNVHRVAIQFDLSEIPANATIDSAFIELNYNNTTLCYTPAGGNGNYGETSFFIEKITEPWEEESITWNNQPATIESGRILVSDTDNPSKDYHINITELVSDAVINPSEYNGFMLKYADESIYKITILASSEHPDQTIRPKLKVYFH
jgi:hypothetical protein